MTRSKPIGEQWRRGRSRTDEGAGDSASVETTLWESEERFRVIFEHAGIGMAIVGQDGRILESNSAMQQMLGYNAKDLAGRPFTELTHPQDRQADWELAQELFSGARDAYALQKRYIHRNGRIIYGRLTATLVRDAWGSPSFGIGMIVDVTEQQTVIEDLRIKEAAMDSAVNAMAIGDAGFRLTYVNQAFLDLWGFTDREAVLGRSAFDFWEDRQAVEELTNALQEAGSWFGELTGRKGDGQRFVAHVSASVVRDGTGQPMAYMGSFVDVTASRESQRELQEKNRQLEEVNTALRVLMDHRDSAREQLSENVLAGVNALVRPCLRRLWESGLTPAQEALADLLEVHLQELTESLPKRLSERFSGITPREMEIAAMIRQGRTSDEIAQALCISRNTVIFHRQNLRAKLGLQGRKKGLCACLREIMD